MFKKPIPGDGLDDAGVAHDARSEVGVGGQGVDEVGVVRDGLQGGNSMGLKNRPEIGPKNHPRVKR